MKAFYAFKDHIGFDPCAQMGVIFVHLFIIDAAKIGIGIQNLCHNSKPMYSITMCSENRKTWSYFCLSEPLKVQKWNRNLRYLFKISGSKTHIWLQSPADGWSHMRLERSKHTDFRAKSLKSLLLLKQCLEAAIEFTGNPGSPGNNDKQSQRKVSVICRLAGSVRMIFSKHCVQEYFKPNNTLRQAELEAYTLNSSEAT